MTPLHALLAAERPSAALAGAALRFVFLAVFGAQALLAAAMGLAFALLGDPRGGAGPLGWVLLGLGLLQPLAALAVVALVPGPAAAARTARDRGEPELAAARRAALWAAILLAVLLATPGWYGAFAAAAGVGGGPLALLLALLAFDYALGVMLAGRLGRQLAGVGEGEDGPGNAGVG